MQKQIVIALGTSLLLLTPFLAGAQAPPAADNSSVIASLQAEIKLLTQELAVLNVAGSTCPITRTLSLGSKGPDVTCLQEFLISQNLLPAGDDTGYFGFLTQAAVQSFQSVQRIISSGSPSTTGYGVVGPSTRAAIVLDPGTT